MASQNSPSRDVQEFGDTIRRRHIGHFEQCATTGRWSGIFFDYLFRDLEPHLLAAVAQLDERARREFTGSQRVAVLNALYERRDKETDRLVMAFISGCDGTAAEGLGFGYIGEGHMGITDPECFRRNLRAFQAGIWSVAVESVPASSSSPGTGFLKK